jgi:hypothetical protein
MVNSGSVNNFHTVTQCWLYSVQTVTGGDKHHFTQVRPFQVIVGILFCGSAFIKRITGRVAVTCRLLSLSISSVQNRFDVLLAFFNTLDSKPGMNGSAYAWGLRCPAYFC